jgi:hypothetical protein
VRELLGDAFELEFEEHVSTVTTESAEAYWDLFATSYGPTKSLYESLGERGAELRRDWIEHFEANYAANGGMAHPRPYLLILGTRR